MTKFIQQDTTNTKHKQLAQTILTTPNMTLGRAASLFETYNPPSGPAAVPTTPTVNAVTCRYCRENTINCQIAQRKSQFPIRRGLKNPIRLHQLSPVQPNASGSLAQSVILWVTCLICVLVVRKLRDVSLSPLGGRLHHLPVPTGSHLSGGAQQSEAGGVMTNFWRVLSDGVVRDEIT